MQRFIDGLVIAAALLTVEAWEMMLLLDEIGEPIARHEPGWISWDTWNAAQAVLTAHDLWAMDRPGDSPVVPSLLLHAVH